MKPSLSRLAAALLAGAAAGLLYAVPQSRTAGGDPSDLNQTQSPPRPAPRWLKIIDQGDLDPRLKGYKTPEGVKVEIVAEDPAVVHPVGLAFADDGTAYVLETRPLRPAESFSDKTVTFTYKDGRKCRWVTAVRSTRDKVKTLSDSRGKNAYNQSKVVFEDDLPSGILLHDGWLYVSGQGTVRRYKQSKADGPYDVKEVVAQGFFGPQFYQASGMTIGPDGWLYVTAGNGDSIVEGSDGSRATVLATGGVFRCRPDGSNMQTYAIGFVDPDRPVSFDAVGDLFHADDGYIKFAGCRLMHVPEGTDFGWRNAGYQSSLPDPVRAAAAGELTGKLPPMLDTGRGKSGGLLIYNDTRFPETYRGLLLYPDSDRKSIRAYKVERKGATFEVAEEFEFLKSDDPLFQPCQAVLGPDGAVYVVDSRSGAKDGEHGRILRITWAGAKDQPALAPRGMDSWAKIAKLGDDDLVKTLLGDEASDRERARRELARRGEKERPALLKLFKDAEQPDAARIAALGALESMWDGDVQAAALFALAKDSAADIRRFAADAVGLNAPKGDDDVQSGLLRALNDVAPEVRRSVALAMSHVAAAAAPDNLVNTWSFEDSRDPYLRAGLVCAIENLGEHGVERLIALGESGVQKDIDKVVEAFSMLRTRPGADAIPRALENPHLSAGQRAALIRSYSNYLLDPPVSLAPAVDYLTAHPEEDAAVKRAGLEALSAGGGFGGDKAADWLLSLLDEKDAKIRLSALKAVEDAKVGKAAPRLVKRLADDSLAGPERAAIVKALRPLNDKSAVPLLKDILADDKPTGPEAEALRTEALRTLAALDPASANPIAKAYLEKKDPALQKEAIQVLAADAEGARLVGRAFLDKKLPPELLPQATEALRRHADKDRECARLLKELGSRE